VAHSRRLLERHVQCIAVAFDQLDRSILAILAKDSRVSLRAIAAQAGCTAPTVAARMQRLADAGILAGFTIRLGAVAAPAIPSTLAASCHYCKQSTSNPIWKRTTRMHPFCCTTCRDAFLKQYKERQKGM